MTGCEKRDAEGGVRGTVSRGRIGAGAADEEEGADGRDESDYAAGDDFHGEWIREVLSVLNRAGRCRVPAIIEGAAFLCSRRGFPMMLPASSVGAR